MRTGRPLSYTEAEIQLVRQLASEGVRAIDIARRLNRPYGGLWSMMKRLGISGQGRYSFPTGQDNPSWNGGRWIDPDGYVMILCPHHPNATLGGYVREHRLVMEESLGRLLLPTEVVHHKDKNKQNNCLSNLELYDSNSTHLKSELTGCIPKWTSDGKRRISEGCRKPRGPLSPETRAKMSVAQKARKRQPLSMETRMKISAARMGKPGPKHSQETKNRLRQAALQRESAKRMSTQQAQENDGTQ